MDAHFDDYSEQQSIAIEEKMALFEVETIESILSMHFISILEHFRSS
jgi:hypothetical protein